MMSSFEVASSPAGSQFVPSPIGPPTVAFQTAADHTAASHREPHAAPLDTRPPSETELSAEYERGYKDGRNAAEAALEGPIEALTKASRELIEQRTLYLHEQRGLLVELALSIAGKIVERELATDPNVLAGLVDRAVGRLDGESPIVVQLSSADHQRATSGEPSALAELAAETDIRFESSRELSDGEARITSGATTIEARIAGMLEQFGEELIDFDAIFAPRANNEDAEKT